MRERVKEETPAIAYKYLKAYCTYGWTKDKEVINKFLPSKGGGTEILLKPRIKWFFLG